MRIVLTTAAELQDVHLYRMSTAEHECPWGLKAIALLTRHGIRFQDHKLTTSEQVAAFKQQQGVSTTPQLFAEGRRIGGYTDLAALLGERAEKAHYSYTPVVAVFGTALLMALVLGDAVMQRFMGFSVCALAMLKLMDVQSFAISFAKYDLITQRIPLWGRVYPGVELLIGLGFLAASPVPLAGWVAFVLGVPGMASVLKAVYVDKLALNCACVGGNSKTPLGIVSFTEYAILTVMGFIVAFGLWP